MLLKDCEGNGTADKHEESMAAKQFLAEKGRGHLTSYEELLTKVRERKRDARTFDLDIDAVVGIMDTRQRAAASVCGKSHGPSGIPTDVHHVAACEMAR